MDVGGSATSFTYFYPLDLNRPSDLAYFEGNTSLGVFKEIYYRTAKEWGSAYSVAGLKGGGVMVGGSSGDISTIRRVQLTAKPVIAFVVQYGRCPTNSELEAMKLPIPTFAISCKFESKYFTKY